MSSIGMIETKGLAALVCATDAMLKAAKVQFKGWKKVGSGSVHHFRYGRRGQCESGSGCRRRRCAFCGRSGERERNRAPSRRPPHGSPKVGSPCFSQKLLEALWRPQKTAEFQGMKLMLVQPYITRDGALVPSGSSVVAVDFIGAGQGQCVLFTQGSSARLTPATKGAPVDALIVGIVDTVEVDGKVLEKP